MRYLLIGNALNSADAVVKAAPSADIIIQHNTCDYAELLPQVRANYVFVTNSGPHAYKIMNRLLALRQTPVFTTTRLILARNRAFYTLKKHLMRARKHPVWPAYRIHRQWNAVSRIWPMQTMSFGSTVRLEGKLLRLGMARWRMPSTGMIAYDWLRRRLQPSDCLFTEGFTFEVWHGHPWAIEKQLIKPIMAMDGQDKPRHGAVSSQV